jgi:hypothetical protein
VACMEVALNTLKLRHLRRMHPTKGLIINLVIPGSHGVVPE